MHSPSRIVGAGLAGLLAAYAWPVIPILESSETPGSGEHKALLRFRSDAVTRLTGIPFRKVTVRKGIYYKGNFVAPSIRLANDYSAKTLGRLVADRSIWSLEPVERWIAPTGFYSRLIEHAGDRIQWGKPDDFALGREAPIVSTAPLPLAMAALDLPPIDLHRAPISVERYRVPGADIFQTVYFPDARISIYRVSMTGDTLIVERAGDAPYNGNLDNDAIRLAFGIDPASLVYLDGGTQKYGKIIPLSEGVRRSILFRLTHDHGVYSLGRFACWRNILLDDVVDDIAVIKRLLQTGDKYDVARARAGDMK